MLSYSGESPNRAMYENLNVRTDILSGAVAESTDAAQNLRASLYFDCDDIMLNSPIGRRFSPAQWAKMEFNNEKLACAKAQWFRFTFEGEIASEFQTPVAREVYRALCGDSANGVLHPEYRDIFGRRSLAEFDNVLLVTDIEVFEPFQGVRLGACLLTGLVNQIVRSPRDLAIVATPVHYGQSLSHAINGFSSIEGVLSDDRNILAHVPNYRATKVLLAA